MVHEVTRDHGLLVTVGDAYAYVTRGVPEAWLKEHLVGDSAGRVGPLDQTRVDHWPYRIGEVSTVDIAVGQPVVVLGSDEQIPGVGEGRNPAPVDQHRVPPDVVGVQVRAHHPVDRLARESGRRQVGQEGSAALVPARHVRAVLVVADAGVHQDRQSTGPHDQRRH
jgi:hypothetical protein